MSRGLWPALLLFAVVFAACLFGIWSRPVGFLASVWPANALMLGVLLRVPGAAHWSGWLAGAAAFMAADLMTGSGLQMALILNTANLLGIAVAYRLLAGLPDELLRLRQPASMLHLVMAALLGSAVAGVVGGFANPYLFGGTVLTGFLFWWATETVNYVAILPILLSAPPWREWSQLRWFRREGFRHGDLLPAIAVVLSCVAVLVIGGPGAIAFPVLALLWCGLVYPVFATAILTLLCSLFAMVFVSSVHFTEFVDGLDKHSLFSIRLGTAVVAIAPIMLSIVIRSRNELLSELRYLSSHDALTGVGNRAAFCEDAARILCEQPSPHAVMMLDLDRFKHINDTHGHAAGDAVLVEVTRRISACLRPMDRLGRLGGEEFAVLLGGCGREDAYDIAERVRRAIAAQPVGLPGGGRVPVTVSIGLTLAQGDGKPLDILLAEADAALYNGKQNGRDRVEFAAAG